jgi:predicted RNase H-like HicB family nuclease
MFEYTATLHWDAPTKLYAVEIHGLPDGHLNWTQGSDRAEAQEMAEDLVRITQEQAGLEGDYSVRLQ